MKGQKIKVNLKIPENLQPIYINSANVSFKPDEFAIAFAHIYPISNNIQGIVKAVIAMTPQYTKLLTEILEENLRKYEQQFGEIKLPNEKSVKNLTYRT